MTTTQPDPPGLTVADALARTGVARATLYRAITRGELHSEKIGDRRVIPVAALDEWDRKRRATENELEQWLGPSTPAEGEPVVQAE